MANFKRTISLKSNSSTAFYEALVAKYEAQIAEGTAVLDTYFNASVGIGEHSDLLTEFDVWIEKIAAAKDKLETLKSLIFNESDYMAKKASRENDSNIIKS
jgi:hypothetical protein